MQNRENDVHANKWMGMDKERKDRCAQTIGMQEDSPSRNRPETKANKSIDTKAQKEIALVQTKESVNKLNGKKPGKPTAGT